MEPYGEYTPEDDLEESSFERLVGLTEMFPEGLRNGVSTVCKVTGNGLTTAYGISRTYTWIFFSSAAVLFAPIIIQSGLQEVEEVAKMQQRQMLLGSGGR